MIDLKDKYKDKDGLRIDITYKYDNINFDNMVKNTILERMRSLCGNSFSHYVSIELELIGSCFFIIAHIALNTSSYENRYVKMVMPKNDIKAYYTDSNIISKGLYISMNDLKQSFKAYVNRLNKITSNY